jgi:hypothetical protein
MKKSKEGVDFVFKQNPDLTNIGSQEDYSEYIKTIFPESKVQDIVYHRGVQKIETFDKSKTKEINGNRFYFSPFDTGRYGQHITQALLNIKNLAVPYDNNFIDDVNKKHPEYTKGKSKWFHLPAQIYINADKYGYDGVFAFKGTNDDEYSVYSPDQIHILGSKQDIKGFKKYTKNKNNSLQSKIISGLFILSFLAGIFLIPFNLTGNIISISTAGGKLLGIILFLLGISGFFTYKKLRS